MQEFVFRPRDRILRLGKRLRDGILSQAAQQWFSFLGIGGIVGIRNNHGRRSRRRTATTSLAPRGCCRRKRQPYILYWCYLEHDLVGSDRTLWFHRVARLVVFEIKTRLE